MFLCLFLFLFLFLFFFQAVQEDISKILVDIIWNINKKPRKSSIYTIKITFTIYNHNYLVTIMDEAHVACSSICSPWTLAYPL